MGAERWRPCAVDQKTSRGESIYERSGVMPDQPHVWVRAERGIRQLLIPELAKGKGVPGEWFAGKKGHSKPIKEDGVRPLTCAHLWAAVLDEVAKRRLEVPVRSSSFPLNRD
jgi:hypothetical protein